MFKSKNASSTNLSFLHFIPSSPSFREKNPSIRKQNVLPRKIILKSIISCFWITKTLGKSIVCQTFFCLAETCFQSIGIDSWHCVLVVYFAYTNIASTYPEKDKLPLQDTTTHLLKLSDPPARLFIRFHRR